jgi:transcriptional regulator with XRE-family HTH domain
MLDLDKLRERIRLLGHAGISHTEIAKRAAMSKQRLANILSGRPATSNLKLDTLDSLANALGMESAELLRGNKPRQ